MNPYDLFYSLFVIQVLLELIIFKSSITSIILSNGNFSFIISYFHRNLEYFTGAIYTKAYDTFNKLRI